MEESYNAVVGKQQNECKLRNDMPFIKTEKNNFTVKYFLFLNTEILHYSLVC